MASARAYSGESPEPLGLLEAFERGAQARRHAVREKIQQAEHLVAPREQAHAGHFRLRALPLAGHAAQDALADLLEQILGLRMVRRRLPEEAGHFAEGLPTVLDPAEAEERLRAHHFPVGHRAPLRPA